MSRARWWLVVGAAGMLVACGGDDSSSATTDASEREASTTARADDAAASTAAPVAATECAASAVDASRTITVRVDVIDDGGFGSIGTRIPSHLTPGPARLDVEVADDDEEPPLVVLSRDGTDVATLDDVAPGTTCGVDIEVEAGEYTITFLDKTKTFTVAAN